MKTLEKLLIKNYSLLFVATKDDSQQFIQSQNTLDALKHQLCEFGYVITNRLETKLMQCGDEQLKYYYELLFNTIRENIGHDVPHRPLYRDFPKNIPIDTNELFLKRLSECLMQGEYQDDWQGVDMGKTHLLSCGHIVHEDHWDRRSYSGCPLCENRVDLTSPFFLPEKRRKKIQEVSKLKMIDLCEDIGSHYLAAYKSLISRKSVLSPKDDEVLSVILTEFTDIIVDLTKSVDKITVKEIAAKVVGTVVSLKGYTLLFDFRHIIKTATDVLRVITQVNNGDVSLNTNTFYSNLTRKDRESILSFLDTLPVDLLTEDMLRHKSKWKRLGEKLHPYEYNLLKNINLAFSVIRESSPKNLEIVKDNPNFVLRNNKLKFLNWNSRFNSAIAAKDIEVVCQLLLSNAGEFSRKIDFVLRTFQSDAKNLNLIFNTFLTTKQKMSTPILLTLLGYLNNRTSSDLDRVFFIKGELSKMFTMSDVREPFSTSVINPFIEEIEKELISRNTKKSHNTAIVDLKLNQLLNPFSEKSSSKALISTPRGSRIDIKKSKVLRTFVHWVEPTNNRVDLDSSYVFYDEDFKYLGKCAYNDRYFGQDAAIHSGDLTSAPAPYGATEFVDLNIKKLTSKKVRYVVANIFSFNKVPFELLTKGFVGFMSIDSPKSGEVFKPNKVEQKFDLKGNAEILIPFILDLKKMEMIWTDMNLTSSTGYVSVEKNFKKLQKIIPAIYNYYNSGVRPTIYQTALLNCAARANKVVLKDGVTYCEYTKKESQSNYSFYLDLKSKVNGTFRSIDDMLLDAPSLAYLYDEDKYISDTAEVYSLYTNPSSTQSKIEAADIISF